MPGLDAAHLAAELAAIRGHVSMCSQAQPLAFHSRPSRLTVQPELGWEISVPKMIQGGYGVEWKELQTQIYVQISNLPLTTCVTLGKLLNFFEPVFSCVTGHTISISEGRCKD